jgi:hypothetical protein
MNKIKDVPGYIKSNAVLCADADLLKEYKQKKQKDRLIKSLQEKVINLEERIKTLEGLILGDSSNKYK